MQKFTYFAYGMRIISTLPLHGLREATDGEASLEPSIEISVGSVPDTIEPTIEHNPICQVNHDEFLLNIHAVASYWVHAGQWVVVQPVDGADSASVELFLTTAAFSALLHQRGMLPLHGSCIDTPRGAVLLGGLTGTGTSTLAAAFSEQGYALLSDDLSVIQLNDAGLPYVLPGYPELHLWRRDVQTLELLKRERLRQLRPEIEKYAFPVDNFQRIPQPLDSIYVLQLTDDSGCLITALPDASKMVLLSQIMYGTRMAIRTDVFRKHWNMIATFAPKVRVAKITRPTQSHNVEKLIEIVQADIKR